MMNKKFFEKIAKKIKQSNKGVENSHIIHPAREWFIGLFFSVLILSGIGVWSWHTYFSYRSTSEIEGVSESDRPVVYRKSVVDSALSEFESRVNLHKSIILENKSAPVEALVSSETSSSSTSTSEINNEVHTNEELELQIESEETTGSDSDLVPQLDF